MGAYLVIGDNEWRFHYKTHNNSLISSYTIACGSYDNSAIGEKRNQVAKGDGVQFKDIFLNNWT